jgi:hypothetical protein
MVEIILEFMGERAVLDCGSVELKSKDIAARMRQLMPILEQLLEADVAKMSLDGSTLQKRLPGIVAQEMNLDDAIYSTALQATLLLEIICDSEPINGNDSLELGGE